MAKVSYVVERVRTILQDNNPIAGGVRWKDDELIRWLNDAQREIVAIRPAANATTEAMELASGSLQQLPENGISLIKATRNMGANGQNPGRSVYISDLDAFINEYPNWHDPTDPMYAGKDLSIATTYFYDNNDPRRFYVFPPNDGTGHLEVTYSKSPTDVASLTDDISINEIYVNQIVDYVLYRCYMKDAGNQNTSERASRHYQLFRESLGLKASAQLSSSPSVKLEQSRMQE